MKKILIFDWDVHHGDGTQYIFKDDPDVLFISLHRYDHSTFYPGESGSYKNLGGKAKGFQINIPWNTID
jgi:histone deacetylase 6